MVIDVVLFGSACTDTGTEPPSQPAEGPSSHDWTWEYTIIDPENTSGWLWDVCYINDTCIWAVGWIQHKGDFYNACHWDGKEWKLEKVFDDPTGSATEPGVHQLHALYGAAADDIWFVKGNAFIHWNGETYRTDRSLVSDIREPLHEIWGNGPDNIYTGGYGEIVHYNGHYWKRLENEIEWDIGAMHGNGDTVLVAATGPSKSGKTAFYT
ncbi:MAG: hypothetical protein RRA94_12770, partial [Bacteroidota bacterium]|nr:hypothetical protein [Bacteroidota bacterium]